LDPENAGIIDSLILEIYKKTNAATFVVTHDLLTLKKIKPVILVLVGGILTGPMTFSEFTHAQEKGHLSFLNRG
jgi:ABC-type transporter Mla maintaining outer membrane lipid asymmetry ATPase subunit MlaF